MIVHFVCSGNSFRSRLAEAYLKSLNIPGVKVMSSGANTSLDHNHLITPYGALILEKYGLSKFASKDKVQLTQARLDAGDITVCVNRDVYRQCLKAGLKLPARTYIWNIDDVKQLLPVDQVKLTHHEIPAVAERIFINIEDHVNELASFIKRPKYKEKIDVLDESGRPTGEVSNIETVHSKGLIHAGAHIGLYTKSGKIVLERRSSNIIFNPGLWDLTMGGVVASGETPEESLIREVKEELGIELSVAQLHKLFVLNYNHYLPHYGFHNHSLTQTYIAEIPEPVNFVIQKSEVAEARLFTAAEVEALNEGNKKSTGNIVPSYANNQRIIDAIKSELAR